MPTTYYTFSPQPTGVPFQFQPTLDGLTYGAAVQWNQFGKRWYLALSTIDGQPIFNQALVASQPAIAIQSITWDNGWATVRCVFPHTFKIGDTNILTVRDCLPNGYNGTYLMQAFDLNTLIYALPIPPGDATALGRVTYDINLAGGYFRQSMLVYRQGTQQFEVYSP